MNFSEAFKQVKQGKGMRLPHWKSDVIVKAQFPDENSKMTAPCLYVESHYGKVPWKETFVELFSEEWEIVDDLKSDTKYYLKEVATSKFHIDSSCATSRWDNTNELFNFFNNLLSSDFIDYCHDWVIIEHYLPYSDAGWTKSISIYEFVMDQYGKKNDKIQNNI